jgi:hypothetical protein
LGVIIHLQAISAGRKLAAVRFRRLCALSTTWLWQNFGLENGPGAAHIIRMIKSLAEFHILERRPEGGWRVKERNADFTADLLVVEFGSLEDADNWITSRQSRPRVNGQ